MSVGSWNGEAEGSRAGTLRSRTGKEKDPDRNRKGNLRPSRQEEESFLICEKDKHPKGSSVIYFYISIFLINFFSVEVQR